MTRRKRAAPLGGAQAIRKECAMDPPSMEASRRSRVQEDPGLLVWETDAGQGHTPVEPGGGDHELSV